MRRRGRAGMTMVPYHRSVLCLPSLSGIGWDLAALLLRYGTLQYTGVGRGSCLPAPLPHFPRPDLVCSDLTSSLRFCCLLFAVVLSLLHCCATAAPTCSFGMLRRMPCSPKEGGYEGRRQGLRQRLCYLMDLDAPAPVPWGEAKAS